MVALTHTGSCDSFQINLPLDRRGSTVHPSSLPLPSLPPSIACQSPFISPSISIPPLVSPLPGWLEFGLSGQRAEVSLLREEGEKEYRRTNWTFKMKFAPPNLFSSCRCAHALFMMEMNSLWLFSSLIRNRLNDLEAALRRRDSHLRLVAERISLCCVGPMRHSLASCFSLVPADYKTY